MDGMVFQAEVKKWGQSVAIILPKQQAKDAGFTIGDKVSVDVKPAFKLSDIWGKLPDMEKRAGKSMDEIFKDMKKDALLRGD